MKFWSILSVPIILFLIGITATYLKSPTLLLLNQGAWLLAFILLMGVIYWLLNHLKVQVDNLSLPNSKIKPFKLNIDMVVAVEEAITRLMGRIKEYENEYWQQTAKQAGDSLKLIFDSSIDGLTGLNNRKYLDTRLPELITKGTSLSIIMLDIDHFKKVNDEYGHQVGDEVLQHFARIIKSTIRPDDLAFRYGGEEFTVVLKSDYNTALAIAERIRNKVEKTPAVTSKGSINITASLGVTHYRTGDTPDTLLQRADKALYKAKNAGRNQVKGVE